MFGWNRFFVATGAGAVLSVTAAQADVAISGKPTQNMSCDAGVCTATAKKAVLNAGDLTRMLANGDLAVRSGGSARDIDIEAPFSWTSASQLTLDASCSIAFHKRVSDAGSAAVTLTTNDDDGGACGNLVFTGGGRLDFWDLNSGLTIDGGPYKLAGDLKTLAKDVSQNVTGRFALAKDYDAKADGAYSASPIGIVFSGRLEGLGHAISHLRVQDASRNDNVGLFSTLGNDSLVENLALTRFSIEAATNSTAGGLAGMTNGIVENVVTDGRLSVPAANSGGLTGYNSGFVAGSFTSGSVTGVTAGGLVGFDFGTIQQSASSAAVKGFDAGGFSGYEAGNVVNSSASGPVQTSVADGAASAGGFVGYFYAGSIVQSFATGEVTGRDSAIGGFAGAFSVTAGGGGISDDYATGAVTGTGLSYVGGFAGGAFESFDLVLARAYSIGAVSGKGKAGGFIGWDEGRMFDYELTDAYWDFDTSGITDPSQGAGDPPDDPGIGGLTDTQLKSGLPAGFDPKVWGQSPNINNGYPYLLANPPQ